MSAGLLASTVTPGRMLPVASVTRPAMLPFCWAETGLGNRDAPASRNADTSSLVTLHLVLETGFERKGTTPRERSVNLAPGRDNLRE
jgi:hypothetical protein